MQRSHAVALSMNCKAPRPAPFLMLGPSNLHLICQILHRLPTIVLTQLVFWPKDYIPTAFDSLTRHLLISDLFNLERQMDGFLHTPPAPYLVGVHITELSSKPQVARAVANFTADLNIEHWIRSSLCSNHTHLALSFQLLVRRNLHYLFVFVISARFVSPRGLLPPESVHARLFHGYPALPQGRLILEADHFHVDVAR